MKKNISINISGIIFHIEEDGFDRLKEYLNSINKYFSSFDDSNEIIADIEGRIAEIFLEKLKEDKQIITSEDVLVLIATMGSIQDFQAVEEDSDTIFEGIKDDSSDPSETPLEPSSSNKKKRLYRDNKRKLVGGVASGIAHYFSIDVVWVRLGFILLLFDVFITLSISSVAFIAYIVLWIAVPGSDNLEEDKSMKKLYRNPDGRVIGGVSQGIATYLDIDITVVRVLFVLSIFLGGTGIIAYLVLWIILPEAKSITDRVQMEGEKVTLENIDSSIKKAKEKDLNPKEESTLSTILLFPFRILGQIFKGIANALTPILNFFVQLVRIFAGFILSVIGVSSFISITIIAIVFLGLLTEVTMFHFDLMPLDLISETIPTIGVIGTYLVLAIPFLLVLLVGVSLLSKRSVITPTFGWALFGVWILGAILMALSIPNVLFQYNENAKVTHTATYPVDYASFRFNINNVEFEEYDGLKVKIKGYDGEVIKTIEEYSAQGPTKREAAENAEMITYNVAQNDSILTFDSNIEFAKNAVFRDQELDLTILIPYSTKFSMDEGFGHLMRYSINFGDFSKSDIKDNVFYFNETGLDCSTCISHENRTDRRRDNYQDVFEESSTVRGDDRVYEFENFDAVKVVGPFELVIAQGEEYRVAISGKDSNIDEIEVFEKDGQLTLAYDEDDIRIFRESRKLRIKIIMPHLNNLSIRGTTVAEVAGFEESKMYVKVASASELQLDSDVKVLEVKVSSASELDLIGSGEVLEIKVSSASQINAYKYIAQNVLIKASSAAKAKVYATKTLSISASSLSDVRYRGGASINKQNSSSLGNISEDE